MNACLCKKVVRKGNNTKLPKKLGKSCTRCMKPKEWISHLALKCQYSRETVIDFT